MIIAIPHHASPAPSWVRSLPFLAVLLAGLLLLAFAITRVAWPYATVRSALVSAIIAATIVYVPIQRFEAGAQRRFIVDTYAPLVAAPVVDERPEMFMLGSSPYGPRFAAANGMSAVFAHHMSPELAVTLLREYRRDFTPREPGAEPYSAMSVLTFASDDEQSVLEFEAGWALTMQNLGRGIREPLRPEQVREFAASDAFRTARRAGLSTSDGRMVTGTADDVVARLRELRTDAQVDEIVLVTPSLDRARRAQSLREIAEAWRRSA